MPLKYFGIAALSSPSSTKFALFAKRAQLIYRKKCIDQFNQIQLRNMMIFLVTGTQMTADVRVQYWWQCVRLLMHIARCNWRYSSLFTKFDRKFSCTQRVSLLPFDTLHNNSSTINFQAHSSIVYITRSALTVWSMICMLVRVRVFRIACECDHSKSNDLISCEPHFDWLRTKME